MTKEETIIYCNSLVKKFNFQFTSIAYGWDKFHEVHERISVSIKTQKKMFEIILGIAIDTNRTVEGIIDLIPTNLKREIQPSKKLIRSKVPQIAEQNGNRKSMNLIKFTEDKKEELVKLLKEKIIEEAQEIFETKNDVDLKYELCDILQAIDDLLILKGITDEEIETIVKAKAFTNGKFIVETDFDDFEDDDVKVYRTAYVLELKEDVNE